MKYIDKLAIAYDRIEKYINECRYTYDVEDMVHAYGCYYLRRAYMSYTTEDVVKHCKVELNALYRYGVKHGLYSNEINKPWFWVYY